MYQDFKPLHKQKLLRIIEDTNNLVFAAQSLKTFYQNIPSCKQLNTTSPTIEADPGIIYTGALIKKGFYLDID